MGLAGAALLLAAIVAGAAYLLQPPAAAPVIAGLVRSTELRIAPEIGGRLAVIRVRSGDVVRRGDVVAKLATPELEAAVAEALAAVGEAQAARDRVYAGVREEQVAILAREIEKAEANVVLAERHHERIADLAARADASKQELDKATAQLGTARAALTSATQRHAEAELGPIKEERAVADAQVAAAEAAAAVLRRRLDKSILLAPSDGIVRVIVAEPGEAVRPGQPVLTIEAREQRWFAFNVREDRLTGVSVGTIVQLVAASDKVIPARVTEVRGLGEFATWRAARAVGDHDLNTFRIRAEPTVGIDLDPGLTVWLPASIASRAP